LQNNMLLQMPAFHVIATAPVLESSVMLLVSPGCLASTSSFFSVFYFSLFSSPHAAAEPAASTSLKAQQLHDIAALCRCWSMPKPAAWTLLQPSCWRAAMLLVSNGCRASTSSFFLSFYFLAFQACMLPQSLQLERRFTCTTVAPLRCTLQVLVNAQARCLDLATALVLESSVMLLVSLGCLASTSSFYSVFSFLAFQACMLPQSLQLERRFTCTTVAPLRCTLQVLVNAQARCLDLATALVLESSVMLLVSPDMKQPLLQRLDKFIFPADDVTVNDVSERCGMLTIMGPQADDVMQELAGVSHNCYMTVT
jgi:hypothetical protein